MSDMERDLELLVDTFMRQLAAIDERPRALPSASELWVKARLLQVSNAADRATRPITTVQILAYLTVAAGWATLLTWKWSALQAWVNSFTPSHIILGAAGAQTQTSLSITMVMALVALASVTVMLAFHTILAEE